MALLSILGATLTLPGIAGIVLTIGMAVDANVLVFERIKEEIKRNSSVYNSIKTGYEKALSSIVDANVTTMIAAVILFFFGSDLSWEIFPCFTSPSKAPTSTVSPSFTLIDLCHTYISAF